jgi:hypothetical protein
METLTYSRIKSRKNCPMAEHIRYELGLAPKQKKGSFALGSAVHRGLETNSIEEAMAIFSDTFPSTQEEQDKLEINKAIVQAMLGGYFQRFGVWPDDTRKESKFSIPIINPETGARSRSFELQGKIDAITAIDGQNWIVEYKTASQINDDYFNRIELDEQVSTYMYAAQKFFEIPIVGIIYRVLKKPSIRQKKTESLEQFCQRLAQDYLNRPEFYFFEGKFYRSQEDLVQYEKELWAFTKQYLYERNHGIHCKNASRCTDFGRCEYMPICLQEADWELIYEKREIHEELKA